MPAASVWEKLSSLATIAVALCAIALVTLRVNDRLSSSRRMNAQLFGIEKNWRDYLNGGHRFGNPSSVLTIVEFGDFQCPVCRAAAPLLDSIVKESRGEISLLFRHFPLSNHVGAKPAAIAIACADSLGRIEPLSSRLWEISADIGPGTSFTRLALDAGVRDTASFARCLTSVWAQEIVNIDSLAGVRLKVGGTPTFLLGETRVNGLPPDRQAFRKSVAEALARARQTSGGTQ